MLLFIWLQNGFDFTFGGLPRSYFQCHGKILVVVNKLYKICDTNTGQEKNVFSIIDIKPRFDIKCKKVI